MTDPVDLGSVQWMRWNVGDRGAMTWHMAVPDAQPYKGIVILMDYACHIKC